MFQKSNTFKRYEGLDFAKFLCSYMVISIHMSYFGKRYIAPLSRFAVPLFFMITGYFYSSIKQKSRERAQIKKTIILFLFSNLLFLFWEIPRCILANESISASLSLLLNIKGWIKFVCLNEPFFSGHLWYLGALLYVLIIILMFDKYSNRQKLYKFIPLLLLVNIVFGNYSVLVFGTKLPLILTRNFLFCGLPFFLLGDILHHKQNSLSQKQLIFVAAISMLLTVAENLFLLHNEKAFNDDCFIATPFLAYSLFVLFLENRNISNSPLLLNIAKLGRCTSATIYIIHPIVISIVGFIINTLGKYFPHAPIVYHYIAPFVILIVCTLFACCYNALTGWFKRLPPLNSAPEIDR